MTVAQTGKLSHHVLGNILWLFSVSVVLWATAPLGSAADWPTLGRDKTRNPVSLEKNPPRDWNVKTGQNIKWSADLGTGAYGTIPVVANGLVWIGGIDKEKGGAALLRCFRESDGKPLYQYVSPRRLGGRIHDPSWLGLACSPLIEGDRLWFVTNLREAVCLDIGPLRESEKPPQVVWKVDMFKELGVYPRGLVMGPSQLCSIGPSYDGRIYVTTSNGVDAGRTKVMAPKAPSLVCFDKTTGKILWTDNSPGENILVGGFSSPLVAEIGGRGQVIAAQGDGWIRSFDALTGKLIWKFDMNPKLSRWYALGGGARNHFLATPVLYNNRIYIASGREAECGSGPGQLVCIDATKEGDISSDLVVDAEGKLVPPRRTFAVESKIGEKVISNSNSGLVWEFGGKIAKDHDEQEFEDQMHCSMSSVAVHDGLVIAPDFEGLLHCLDAETGQQYWTCDLLASIWASPVIVDDKVFIADEDGVVSIFHLSKDPDKALKQKEQQNVALASIEMNSGVHTSPIYANGSLYVATRSQLFAIATEEKQAPEDDRTSGHWPQWRGPQRDNVSQETGLLQQWPEAGPPLAWSLSGLGAGIGTISVAGGRLFAISRKDDEEYVVALNEQTGEHVWTAPIGRTIEQQAVMQWLTQRSPTVDDDLLYAVTALGDVTCLRAPDGQRLWHKRYVEDFEGKIGPWGFGDRPVVDGDKLIVTPGGDVNSVMALDKRSGEQLWKCSVRGNGRGVYSPGVVAEIDGKRQFITAFGTTVMGIAVSDGELLWQTETKAARSQTPFTPFVRGRNIVYPLGFGKDVATLEIVSQDGQFTPKVNHIATAFLDGFHDSTFVLGDHLYLFDRRANCLNWKTGEELWRKRIGQRMAAVTYADNRAYLRDSSGLVTLWEVTPQDLTENGRFQLVNPGEAGATHPVIAGGRLYLRDGDRLFCYDVRRQESGALQPASRTISLPELDKRLSSAKNHKVEREDPPQGTPDSVFVPTPDDVVDAMLELAKPEKGELLVDLGSGDGRVLIAAAKKYGVKAIGYEIDNDLVQLSRDSAKREDLQNLVSIQKEDMFAADLSVADVVFVYQPPRLLERMLPQFGKLGPRARIVSHQFEIPGLKPAKAIIMKSKATGEEHKIFLWRAPRATTGDPR